MPITLYCLLNLISTITISSLVNSQNIESHEFTDFILTYEGNVNDNQGYMRQF